jgi:hypothetical protein
MATVETRVVPSSPRKRRAYVAVGALLAAGMGLIAARAESTLPVMKTAARAGAETDLATHAFLATAAGAPAPVVVAAPVIKPAAAALPSARPQAGPTTKKSLFDRRF